MLDGCECRRICSLSFRAVNIQGKSFKEALKDWPCRVRSRSIERWQRKFVCTRICEKADVGELRPRGSESSCSLIIASLTEMYAIKKPQMEMHSEKYIGLLDLLLCSDYYGLFTNNIYI